MPLADPRAPNTYITQEAGGPCLQFTDTPPYTPPPTILCGPATMCYPIYLGPYDYP